MSIKLTKKEKDEITIDISHILNTVSLAPEDRQTRIDIINKLNNICSESKNLKKPELPKPSKLKSVFIFNEEYISGTKGVWDKNSTKTSPDNSSIRNTVTILLELDYDRKWCIIKPKEGSGKNFLFDHHSENFNEWRAVTKAITRAIDFAEKELKRE